MAAQKKKPGTTQLRVQEIAEELTSAASRLREALDDARPASASEVEELRREVAALAKRVGALERAGKAKPPSSRVPAARAAARRAPKRG